LEQELQQEERLQAWLLRQQQVVMPLHWQPHPPA
jgi:hypothetical protein